MGRERPPGLANQRAVRRHNLGVVLRHVSEHGPRSRATIALETGLNKTTVSSLVTELIGLDLLVERGLEQRGTVGRPGQVVELSGGGVVALGLEINVDYLAVRALDLTGADRHRGLDVRDNRRVPVAKVLDRLAGLASAALDAVAGRGPAAGGRDGGAARASWTPAAARCWSRPTSAGTTSPVVDELHERLSGPTFPLAADNEANLAALAELWEGTARGLSDVLYVSGEIGVGAGIIVRRGAVPRRPGLRRRVRPHDARPGRQAVRVRQPRLPGDRWRASRRCWRPPAWTRRRRRPRPARAGR